MTKAELEAKNHELRAQIIALRNIIEEAPRILIVRGDDMYGNKFECIEDYDTEQFEEIARFINDPSGAADFGVCSLPTNDEPGDDEAMEVAIIPINMLTTKVNARSLLP